jgi:dienelactone hydrolase
MNIQKIVFLLLIIIWSNILYAQRVVNFYSEDGVKITADIYETEKETDKYMLLFHQAEYSRGEHKETARRLIKLGFNCIAVDLRHGNEVNYVVNETAQFARENNISHSMLDAEKDILASIKYTQKTFSGAKIFLFGSSFSASLCLKIAKEKGNIESVIAFSPGEFFEPQLNIQKNITGLSIPIFVACPKSELKYITDILSGIADKNKEIFTPERGDGLHGSKTLWWESSTRNEYWLALLFYLKDFK